MRTRFQPRRKVTKRRPASDTQPQTFVQTKSQCSEPDPQIQQSNTQLSNTLSTYYNPKQIRCRQIQKDTITKFLKNCILSNGQQGSRVLYISGVPGVGKTVSVMQIVNRFKKTISYRKVAIRYINAMSLLMPVHIYTAINKQLYKPQKNDIKSNPPLKLMLKLQQDKRVKIIIIDQVDYLYTRNQNVLYNLFQWCNVPDTKLCTIIIANTMDFPEKLQNKLQSRMGNNRIVFRPYNQKQVQLIVEERLMKSNRFSKQAVQYACKKMSSFTSDVRKLLDVLRRALQQKKQGIITIDDMFQTWKIFAQDTGDLWQQTLPQFYRTIMNIVKQQGGISTNYKIHERMCANKKYHLNEIMVAIKQMQEMGLFKIKPKRKGALNIIQVTLLKI